MSNRHLLDAVANIPQSEPLNKRQVANSAGGFSFAVDDWKRLDRFLILGSEGGSYYANERKLTLENLDVVRRCIALDGPRTVARIANISHEGRAPKNDQAIFALAVALKQGNLATRQTARAAVPTVCRIGTHIFQLAEAVNALGGWGRNTCKAFTDWYSNQSAEDLAYQAAKYQQRNGWSHLDVMRLAHVGNRPHEIGHEAVYRWIHRKAAKDQTNPLSARTVRHRLGNASGHYREDKYDAIPSTALPTILHALDDIQTAPDAQYTAQVIREHNLPRECVPSEHLNSIEVWDSLLYAGRGMPMTAMIRNLGKMSEVGLLTPNSNAAKFVSDRLRDEAELKKARVHPIALLLAQRVYASDHGMKGSLSWTPVQPVLKALDDAFYLAFAAVKPTGKRRMIALDVSGSMASGNVAGTTLTPREASAAMACITARLEDQYHCIAFTAHAERYRDGVSDFPLDGRSTIDSVMKRMDGLNFGATDCALPMLHALEHKIPVDAFEIYTDSETWAGNVHPTKALQMYREKMGIPAKLIVVGMVSNGFSIADPNDTGMLDVVGFDAAAPAIMNDFIRE